MLELNSRFDITIPRSEFEDMESHHKSLICNLDSQFTQLNSKVPSRVEVDAMLEKNMRDIRAQFISNYTFHDYKAHVDKTLKDFMVTNEQAKSAIALIESAFNSMNEQLGSKVDRTSFSALAKEVRQACKYSDLKELYAKTIPALQNFEKELIA